jgi:hypothetical protein
MSVTDIRIDDLGVSGLYCALSGLVVVAIVSRGVAPGCYIAPFQGLCWRRSGLRGVAPGYYIAPFQGLCRWRLRPRGVAPGYYIAPFQGLCRWRLRPRGVAPGALPLAITLRPFRACVRGDCVPGALLQGRCSRALPLAITLRPFRACGGGDRVQGRCPWLLLGLVYRYARLV